MYTFFFVGGGGVGKLFSAQELFLNLNCYGDKFILFYIVNDPGCFNYFEKYFELGRFISRKKFPSWLRDLISMIFIIWLRT